ncbi:hypothetical protein ACFRAR_20680 [Kitasatospora sp. NPDC056651]|uniref:hypothetical protein n=1 Tax=Kitasatospora sp. NPDC056651 TaxID=3345892 RepID=UPI003692E960
MNAHPADRDALRFHACLLWSHGRPPVLDERELAETIQVVLIEEVEQWIDQLFRSAAGPFGVGHVVRPAMERDGVAGRLLRTVPRELRRWLSTEGFAPDLAAAALARATAQARRDVQRLGRSPLVRPEVRGARLAAHVELLAVLALAARPMLPGWSAFIAGQLGVPADLRRSAGGRLVRPGRRLPAELPGYFRLPPEV